MECSETDCFPQKIMNQCEGLLKVITHKRHGKEVDYGKKNICRKKFEV